MTVTVEVPNEDNILHICANLRDADRSEIFGLMWEDDPHVMANGLLARPLGMTDVFCVDDEPVSILGTIPYWPGVWEVFAFGTDKWDKAVISLTKRAFRFMVPAIYNAGGHRAQCWSEATHTDAHKWLTGVMHAQHEATARGYGKAGQDYHLYSWDRETMVKMMEAHHVSWWS